MSFSRYRIRKADFKSVEDFDKLDEHEKSNMSLIDDAFEKTLDFDSKRGLGMSTKRYEGSGCTFFKYCFY